MLVFGISIALNNSQCVKVLDTHWALTISLSCIRCQISYKKGEVLMKIIIIRL